MKVLLCSMIALLTAHGWRENREMLRLRDDAEDLKSSLAQLHTELHDLREQAGSDRSLILDPVPDAKARWQVNQDLNNLQTQLEMYAASNGSLPSTEQGLQALMSFPAESPKPARWHQLMREVPRDPRCHPYHFEVPAKRTSGHAYDLYSAGPDGLFGTADDMAGVY